MTVVTWNNFNQVLIDIKPACIKRLRDTLDEIIKWAFDLRGQMQGVNQTEINWTKNFLSTLSFQFTGESKADLKRCIKFLGWVNGTIPSYEIDTQRVCELNYYY